MKLIKNFLISLTVLVSGFVAVPALALAATPPTSTQTACSAVTGNADCVDHSGGPSLNKLVATTINVLSIMVAIIAVIMIIVGGLRYVTSNGDANSISGAKSTIIYAVIGLVVAALAQALVKFVLNKIT